MSHRQHRREGPGAVPCAIITASDTRDETTDASGGRIRRALLKAGHPVVDYRILKDEPARIAAHLRALAERGDVRVVLISGGTGIAPRDRTYEAVAALIEKRLDGFGELFRALSFGTIGPSAMLSRAVTGTFRGMILFSMPGSEDAVWLAMRRLILPELSHIAGLLVRGKE
jgi:molybdenum cofactor biosynthesis protein B